MSASMAATRLSFKLAMEFLRELYFVSKQDRFRERIKSFPSSVALVLCSSGCEQALT